MTEGRPRLESWKEIASFLDVSVRTAQSWEKDRGLPVCRHPGAARSRVYAYVDELEAWLEGPPASSPLDPHAPATSPEGVAAPKRGPGRRALTAVALVPILIALAWAAWPQPPGAPAYCEVRDDVLIVRDARDRVVWTRGFPELDDRFYPEPALKSACWVDDLDDDGTVEVLFDERHANRLTRAATLHAFESDGAPRWSRAPGGGLGPGDPRLAPSFVTERIHPVRDGDRPALLVVAHQNPLYPSEVALLDARTGEEIGAPYHHPGHLYAFDRVQFDDDPELEFVLGGLRNPGAGHRGEPVVLVLDHPFGVGEDVGRDAFDGTSARPRLYLTLAVPGLADALDQRTTVHHVEATGPGRVAARVRVGRLLAAVLTLELTPRPRVVGVVVADQYRARHRELLAEGILDEPLDPRAFERLGRVEATVGPDATDGSDPGATSASLLPPRRESWDSR